MHTLDGYLARIGFSGRLAVDLDTLRRLHVGHVGAIPFENLDVQAGRGVDLSVPALFDKLVVRRRGGYCFEHNTLFLHVLRTIGFEAGACEARVRAAVTDGVVRPRTHMLLLVRADQRDWLADVGFGADGLLEPLPMDGTAVYQVDRLFRVTLEGGLRVVQWKQDGDWQDDYAFVSSPVFPVDIELANWWVSMHPSSSFRRRLTVQRTLPDARYTIRQLTYTIRRAGATETRELAREQIASVLLEEFGLDIGDMELPALDAMAAVLPS
jgi:N-hydroxyarylamine O-acetyltransferase